MISISVMLAASSRPSRRGEPARETAMTAPNYLHRVSTVSLEGKSSATDTQSRIRRHETLQIKLWTCIGGGRAAGALPCRTIGRAAVQKIDDAEEQQEKQPALLAPVHGYLAFQSATAWCQPNGLKSSCKPWPAKARCVLLEPDIKHWPRVGGCGAERASTRVAPVL